LYREGDLRGYVEGRNLNGLLKWFKTASNREVMPLREFYEELVTPGLLSSSTFQYIDFCYAGTVWSPIFTMDKGGYGCFVHDVFDLIVTEPQAEELEKLQATKHPKAYFASEEEIMRLGHSPDGPTQPVNISRHTRNALTLKWT
jgi:hypothetical protein